MSCRHSQLYTANWRTNWEKLTKWRCRRRRSSCLWPVTQGNCVTRSAVFEQERLQHRRISLNKVLGRTALATGINKNLTFKARTLQDVQHCKKKTGAPISVRQANYIPENFSSVVRHVIREINLDGTSDPILDLILDKLLQKRVHDFEHLDLFHGREIPNLSSSLWVWSHLNL